MHVRVREGVLTIEGATVSHGPGWSGRYRGRGAPTSKGREVGGGPGADRVRPSTLPCVTRKPAGSCVTPQGA